MRIKLPEIKTETLLKGASLLFMVGGAIVGNMINANNQKASNEQMKAEVKEELMKEIFNQQNS